MDPGACVVGGHVELGRPRPQLIPPHTTPPNRLTDGRGPAQFLTVVAVPDAVLKDGVPLGLLFLSHHAEVVMLAVWVPQDDAVLGRAHQEWSSARFGFHTCNTHAHTQINKTTHPQTRSLLVQN